MIKKIMLGTSIIATLTLSACSTPQPQSEMHHVGMANPASVYCEKIGGKSIIKKQQDGDIGYCQFANGQVVEEWDLYRKDHPKP